MLMIWKMVGRCSTQKKASSWMAACLMNKGNVQIYLILCCAPGDFALFLFRLLNMSPCRLSTDVHVFDIVVHAELYNSTSIDGSFCLVVSYSQKQSAGQRWFWQESTGRYFFEVPELHGLICGTNQVRNNAFEKRGKREEVHKCPVHSLFQLVPQLSATFYVLDCFFSFLCEVQTRSCQQALANSGSCSGQVSPSA